MSRPVGGRSRRLCPGAHSASFVASGQQLVADPFNAVHVASLVLSCQPIPEGGAEIEPVVKVLGADEDVGIQKVGHLNTYP